MSFEVIYKDADMRMKKSIEALQTELAKLRMGRANPSLLAHVMVDYYGSMVPISQVANIGVQDARTLTVSPWEKKMVQAIEKAIMTSDLGLNPATSGELIRIPLPPLNEERRRELVKIVKTEVEEAKVAVRNVRRDVNHQVKESVKAKLMTEDEEHKAQDRVQKLTDAAILEMDKIFSKKETELLEV
ncbi:MAG: ribosome recycling factor [Gammaproteobacteria bacterium]|nr:ribosome recycling factor [Gammaproteobacteria bacterium]